MAVKRSIYLINPNFQLKFSAFVSSLVFIPSLLYPYTIYKLVNLLVEKMESPALAANLLSNQSKLVLLLVLWQLAFTALVFVICIFQSHKIAGPMFKLRRYLDEIKNGQPIGHLFFRKGDNFQEVAEDFNEAMNKVKELNDQDLSDLQAIEKSINEIESKDNDSSLNKLEEARKKISELIARHQ